MAEKIDFARQNKQLYAPSIKQPEIVEVPSFNFLMIDGHGDPNNNPVYSETLSALFTFSYSLKFTVKKQQGVDYAVMPLEGLWWARDMSVFATGDKSAWDWTMMIAQPEFITPALLEEVRPGLSRKIAPPMLEKVRFEAYVEGLSVQLMHIGPYSAEGPNIARMHAFALEAGYQNAGKHHEIYMSDYRRTAPERLKTVLRQPIRRQPSPAA